MGKTQGKLYKLGQKPKGGGAPVRSGVQQGSTSKHAAATRPTRSRTALSTTADLANRSSEERKASAAEI